MILPSEKNTSHRWLSGDTLDVDAFTLDGGRWALFANARAAFARADLEKLAEEFPHGEVAVAGGAVKAGDAAQSVSLEPVWFSQPMEVICREGEDRFRLELENVLNPGLFLDQAENRRFLRENAKPGQTLLNLFCYTATFSVGAAGSGCAETTSVDVSARYLAWAKKNFTLNGLVAEKLHAFVKDDARDFLRKAAAKKRKFTWIVLDPPTFSRSDGKVFQVQKHLPELLAACLAVWDGRGGILVSTNDSTWERFDLEKKMRAQLRPEKVLLQPLALPQEFARLRNYPLKGFWILPA